MRIFTIVAVLSVAVVMGGATMALAHCGSCEGDKKQSHKDHVDTLKPYKEGACCSADHYKKEQIKAMKAKAKAEYKEGKCCSADHYASKKVEAVEKATYMKEYKKGDCCSAEHYAKKKMKAAKKAAK